MDSNTLNARLQLLKDNQTLFIIFSTDCKMFDKYLQVKEVNEVLSKAFDVFHVNLDKDEGATILEAQVKGNEEIEGVPQFAFAQKNGNIVTSNYPVSGNLGYPASPGESEIFIKLVTENSNGLNDEDLSVLKKHLIRYNY